jgi:hypothetical protein
MAQYTGVLAIANSSQATISSMPSQFHKNPVVY